MGSCKCSCQCRSNFAPINQPDSQRRVDYALILGTAQWMVLDRRLGGGFRAGSTLAGLSESVLVRIILQSKTWTTTTIPRAYTTEFLRIDWRAFCGRHSGRDYLPLGRRCETMVDFIPDGLQFLFVCPTLASLLHLFTICVTCYQLFQHYSPFLVCTLPRTVSPAAPFAHQRQKRVQRSSEVGASPKIIGSTC